MPSKLIERDGWRILLADRLEAPVASARDAVTLMEQAFEHHASVIAVAASCLAPEFFRLRTGVAGEIVQKFANYGMKFALLGDISAQVAASDALRDFVRESNRGTSIMFVDDLDALIARLGAR